MSANISTEDMLHRCAYLEQALRDIRQLMGDEPSRDRDEEVINIADAVIGAKVDPEGER